MRLTHQDINLRLEHPFKISRGTQLVASNVLVHVEHDGIFGVGEAAPSTYYGEDQATVHAALNILEPALGDDPFALEAILERFDATIGGHGAAKAAIDIALHDWVGKRLALPVWRLFGLSAEAAPQTSFTIGIDTPEKMAEKAASARNFPILKVKVGTPNDRENLAAIRHVSDARIRVDANAAWTPKEAIAALRSLEEFRLEFVEQPVAAGDLDGLRFVRENVGIPVICDESCVVSSDIPKVAGKVDGINIKLVKCGGLRRAMHMIRTAKAHGLLVMMGCMIESGILITAASHLSPLLDFADLDGNLLLAEDPYPGVVVNNGWLRLPSGPGLGVGSR